MFSGKGITIGQVTCLTSVETFELCRQGAVLVDIRKEYETTYKKFDVETLINIPKDLLENNLDQLDKSKQIIVADSAGNSTKTVAIFLMKNGFENVASLIGGMMEWHRDKMPVLINNKAELATPKFYDSKPKNHIKTSLK